MLDARLAQAGLSARAFARLVGTTAPRISEMRRGKRLAPLKQMEKWASVLNISSKADRERFLDLAALTHAPHRIQELVIAAELKLKRPLREFAGK
jgi:transcriptional regulator with XRE-family HTH domain